MKRKKTALLLLMLSCASLALGQVPSTMSFQGTLRDASGALVNGNQNLTFRIYTAATGGAALWTETQTNVPVRRGIFNVALGSVTALNLSFDRPYWLGITIGTSAELNPRTALTSSPYTFNSKSLILPFGGSAATSPNGSLPASPVFEIIQTGTGPTGRFNIRNASNSNTAFEALTNGTGRAGFFQIQNSSNTNSALIANTQGNGNALFALAYGRGHAAQIEIDNTSNNQSALHAITNGIGPAISATNSAGNGIPGATIRAENSSTGSGIAAELKANGTDATVVLQNFGAGPLMKGFGRNGGSDEFRFENDGSLIIFDSSFRTSIRLNASNGRTTTKVLEITGGSDLSENFDISESAAKESDDLQPGMVVSIDATNPGKLVLTREAYDRKVAGIISGAGGIATGMLMGQKDSPADGTTPVALAGRVYCWADAALGEIKPGDLLTTSGTPGHAMKVNDHHQAQGAIIGKAMTSLAAGKGLVLVLVSLQ